MTPAYTPKSVAVVTLVGLFNYGNLLQRRAVDLKLRERGCDPVFLSFQDDSAQRCVIRAARIVAKEVLGRRKIRPPECSMSPERLSRFRIFSSSMAERLVYHDGVRSLKSETNLSGYLPETYDAYVAGSDQIWNPDMYGGSRIGLLRFVAPESRRIALSASFGVSELPPRHRTEYCEALDAFGSISVREEAGAEIVESLIGRRPSVLCDPTLALPREEWECMANDSLNPSGPYVFTYLLGETDSWREDLFADLAKAYGGSSSAATVARLSCRDDGFQLPAGPAEFIALIAGAEHVVTDSFHCALFAALFERPLSIVHRAETGPSMFSRLETLSDKLGLWGKVVDQDGEPDLDAAADYSGVAERIAAERTAFDAYLDEALGAVRL